MNGARTDPITIEEIIRGEKELKLIFQPAIVAKPPVSTACSSEVVILGIKGMIINGASDIPTKIFAAAFID